MAPPGEPETAVVPRHAWDGVGIGTAALLVYVLLLQDRFVNEDAYVFLNAMGQGLGASSLHPLYGPIAKTLADVFSWFGLSLYRSLELVSTLGVVVAVLLFHASTAYLGMSRQRRNLATGLMAVTPCIVFFATVLEIPGLFLGFAAAAWWLAARYSLKPSWIGGALIGVATGVTAMVHQTGHPLAGLVVAFLWSRPGQTAARRVRAAVIVLLAHVVAYVILERILLGSSEKIGQGAGWFLSYMSGRTSLKQLLVVSWREYLSPFFPLSVLAAVCLLRSATRPQAGLYHACVAVYVFISFVMIPGLDERGTYGLPLVFFGAVVVGTGMRPAVLAGAIVLALACAVYEVRRHDVAPENPVPAGDVLALAPDGNAVFVLEGRGECDPVLMRSPEVPVTRAFQLAAWPQRGQGLFATFDSYIEQFRRKGRAIWFSDTALDFLAERRAELHRHVTTKYRLERVVSGEFVAYRLLP